jgi:uncharacterized protein
MAKAVFVDTGYLVALLSRNDSLHAEAKKLSETLENRSFLSTDAVLFELGNYFAKSPLRTVALKTIRDIRGATDWRVERCTESLIARAEVRYDSHPDKTWSLTDCLSMEVMQDQGSTEVAGADRHFVQAGFRLLLGLAKAH